MCITFLSSNREPGFTPDFSYLNINHDLSLNERGSKNETKERPKQEANCRLQRLSRLLSASTLAYLYAV